MKKTLEVVNGLKEHGIIEEYAIGGAIAALKWTEPFFTRDLDLFIIPEKKVGSEELLVLSSVYDYLKAKGYDTWTGQWLMIEEIPVEFIPAEGVAEEAVVNAVETVFEGVQTRVISPEYLIALFLKASREKDIVKIRMLLDQATVDIDHVKDIVRRYGLSDRFERFANE
ncbi:MAG: nucleotidyltransferase [Bacteroidota bacterium]